MADARLSEGDFEFNRKSKIDDARLILGKAASNDELRIVFVDSQMSRSVGIATEGMTELCSVRWKGICEFR